MLLKRAAALRTLLHTLRRRLRRSRRHRSARQMSEPEVQRQRGAVLLRAVAMPQQHRVFNVLQVAGDGAAGTAAAIASCAGKLRSVK